LTEAKTDSPVVAWCAADGPWRHSAERRPALLRRQTPRAGGSGPEAGQLSAAVWQTRRERWLGKDVVTGAWALLHKGRSPSVMEISHENGNGGNRVGG